MVVGALTWLTGELWGVHRNATVRHPGKDTTSQWVWWLERKVPFTRVLIGVFFASLIGHLLWHGILLP